MTPHRLVLALGLALSLATAAAARQVTVSGPLEVLQIDDFDHGKSRVVNRVRDERTGRTYELEGVPSGVKHGTHVRAQGRLKRGVRRDGARVLAGVAGPAVALETLDAGMPAPAALVTGGRKALVMVVNFSQDGKAVECSDSAIASTAPLLSASNDACHMPRLWLSSCA